MRFSKWSLAQGEIKDGLSEINGLISEIWDLVPASEKKSKRAPLVAKGLILAQGKILQAIQSLRRKKKK